MFKYISLKLDYSHKVDTLAVLSNKWENGDNIDRLLHTTPQFLHPPRPLCLIVLAWPAAAASLFNSYNILFLECRPSTQIECEKFCKANRYKLSKCTQSGNSTKVHIPLACHRAARFVGELACPVLLLNSHRRLGYLNVEKKPLFKGKINGTHV